MSLVVFIIAELKTTQPFVEIRLYKNLPFAMGCLIGFLNTMEFRGTNFLLPIMLQRIYHYTPFQAGLFFLPPALVMGITSILAGRLSDNIQPKLLLIIGLLGLTYVSFKFCGLDVWATTGRSPRAGRAASGGAGVLPLPAELIHAARRAGRPGADGERPLQPASHRWRGPWGWPSPRR